MGIDVANGVDRSIRYTLARARGVAAPRRDPARAARPANRKGIKRGVVIGLAISAGLWLLMILGIQLI